MIYLVVALFIVVIILGPQLWVRYVLARYSSEVADLPGTGGELATHLLKRFDLEQVKVEPIEADQDHYSPADNAVRLGPTAFHGKSLTAVAVAAHEVGHAIQFNRQEPVSQLRDRYLSKALHVQRWGAGILMLLPLVTAVFHLPHVIGITALVGVLTMLASVLMYVAILPEEWDASFNKALPILLDGDYVSERQLYAVRQVLKACAMTYVATALADILRLWRWVAILRGIR